MKHSSCHFLLSMLLLFHIPTENVLSVSPASGKAKRHQEAHIVDLQQFKAEGGDTVRVYPEITRDIGGYTEVQEVFGIMTANLDSRAISYLEEANIQAIRTIFNWLPQPGQAGYVPGSLEWYDEFLQKDAYSFWRPLLNNQYIRQHLDDTYGDVAVTLCGNPALYDPKLERDLEAAKRNVAGYVKALKSLNPDNAQSKLRFFQITNEPEYYAESFDGNQKLAVESYARIYNAVYDFVRAKHPDVELPANCVGHNGGYHIEPHSMPPTWDVWVKHFIDLVENPDALKYFNTQQYSIPTLRHLAYVSMTQNYAEMNKGVKPRFLFTETSTKLNASRAENYRNQFIYHGNDIFMMLNHPDKYVTRHAFLAASGWDYSFFNEIEGEGFTPEAPYWFYRTFQHLRGKNLYFASDHEHVRVFASSPAKNKVVIGLLNPTRGTQTVTLNPGIAEGQISGIVRRKAYFNNSISNASYTEGEVSIDFPYAVEMEPVSSYAFEIELHNDIEQDETVKRREFYGSKVRKPMNDSIRLNISIPYLPDNHAKVYLRMAVSQRPTGGNYTVSMNGKPYTVNWSQTPDATANCWNSMVGWIELPVKKEDIRKNNELVLAPLSDNFLMFTSLTYELFSFEKVVDQ